MITLSKNGNAIVFTFEDSQHYLVGDGVIEVPVNSLALITDDSQMATFKKAASNDIFVSATYAEFGKTKDELISWYKDNCVSAGGGGGTGSGVTSGDVETMITTALEDYPTIEDVSEDLENYYDKDEIDAGFSSVTQDIAAATSGLAQSSAVTAINSSLTAHTADTTIHVTSADKTAWNAKQDALTAGSGISINNNVISCTVSGGGNANIIEVTQAQYDALVSGGTVDPDALYVITDATEINLSGYAQSSAVTEEIAAAVSGKTDTSAFTAHTADTTIHTTSQEKSTWSGKQDALVSGTNIKTINGESILGSGNITISGGGSGTVDSTLDSGSTNPVANSAITNAIDNIETVASAAINALQTSKVDTSAITTSVTSASTDSQIPTAKAVYDATSGGGATYSAGTNISIDTANTINCTLNLRNGTGANSVAGVQSVAKGKHTFAFGASASAGTKTSDETAFAFGSNCIARKGRTFAFGANVDVKEIDSAAFGEQVTLNAPRSFGGGFHITTNNWTNAAFGEYITTNNRGEFGCGQYNNSVNDNTTSGQTLFSVGNGTADNATHNAFEIRQNGDIYCSNGTSDVKLQDYLQVKVVKISQSDYDALVQGGTVDANTLYLITNVVS